MTRAAAGRASAREPGVLWMSVVELGQGSLVALLGCAGSGKTSFAHRHFARYQVLSSDVCRGQRWTS